MRLTFIKTPQTATEKLAQALGISESLSRILVQRNVKNFEQAQSFFRPKLEDLHDPFLMKDMQKAVARIQKALKEGEKILIYGDYDVDGTCAVSLMQKLFRVFTGGYFVVYPRSLQGRLWCFF